MATGVDKVLLYHDVVQIQVLVDGLLFVKELFFEPLYHLVGAEYSHVVEGHYLGIGTGRVYDTVAAFDVNDIDEELFPPVELTQSTPYILCILGYLQVGKVSVPSRYVVDGVSQPAVCSVWVRSFSSRQPP